MLLGIVDEVLFKRMQLLENGTFPKPLKQYESQGKQNTGQKAEET